jgi:hypothetical protein
MIAKIYSAVLLLGVNAGLSSAATIKRAEAAPTVVWQPAVGDAWQIVLGNRLKLGSGDPAVPANVPIFDIDLYENTLNGTDSSIIDRLHALQKKVICYFSAGTYEDFRLDEGEFKPEDKGNPLEDPHFKDELWLNLDSPNVQRIIAKRIEMASKMGCDAIDPDNMDGYVSSQCELHTRNRLAEQSSSF